MKLQYIHPIEGETQAYGHFHLKTGDVREFDSEYLYRKALRSGHWAEPKPEPQEAPPVPPAGAQEAKQDAPAKRRGRPRKQ
jgi:hypothetical protein